MEFTFDGLLGCLTPQICRWTTGVPDLAAPSDSQACQLAPAPLLCDRMNASHITQLGALLNDIRPVPTPPPAPDDAAIRRMAAFAVTTVDWSNQRRSYLDNFLNYVLAVVPPTSSTAFPVEAIRPSIVQQFNLQLPVSIVQQLVKRGVKLGYVDMVSPHALTLSEKGKREVSPIPYTLKKLSEEQRTVAEQFKDWAGKKLGVTMDQARATSILLNYVETYYCSLMVLADGGGATDRFPQIEPTAEQKLAAAFIASLDENGSLFESIANMARGSMMVSALYSTSLVDTTRGFRGTTLYLDTKIALRALGYEGEPAQQSTRELIDLLIRQNARVAVFDFTLREIRSVLDAVAAKARGGRIWDARPGTVESFFYRIDASNAVIEQHSIRVESELQSLGLAVDPAPSFENHRFVIDEGEVEAMLLAGNPYYRNTALQHDVQLIASVVRARGGRARDSLEESRATFVTLNSLVVETARSVQGQYRESWPLVMFETDVASLTWIKEPVAAPNLPKHQLLATSLGVMNPGKHDWDLYISEITRLLSSGEITDNDVILLRQKYEIDKLAFVPRTSDETTRRKEIRLSIEQAKDEVAAALTAPVRAENEQLEAQLAEATAASAATEQQADRLLRALLAPKWRRGNALQWVLFGAAFVLCGSAILASFVPEWMNSIGRMPLGDWLVGGIRLIAVLAAIGGGLSGAFRSLGRWAKKRYLLRSLRKFDVEPDKAASLGFSVV